MEFVQPDNALFIMDSFQLFLEITQIVELNRTAFTYEKKFYNQNTNGQANIEHYFL
jgi:hypothetical protein